MSVSGRPQSLEIRLNSSVAGGVKLRIRKFLSRNIVAICVLSNRLRRSLWARSSSSTFEFSSALTVCSSSLTDCSSSFEVSSSSLVDCSSSLIDCSSSLDDFSSSTAVSYSSIVDCSRSRVSRSSLLQLSGMFVWPSGRQTGIRVPVGGQLRPTSLNRTRNSGSVVRPEGLDRQVDELLAVVELHLERVRGHYACASCHRLAQARPADRAAILARPWPAIAGSVSRSPARDICRSGARNGGCLLQRSPRRARAQTAPRPGSPPLAPQIGGSRARLLPQLASRRKPHACGRKNGNRQRAGRMVAPLKNALLLVHGREQVRVLGHVLRRPEEQEATLAQGKMEHRDHLRLKSRARDRSKGCGTKSGRCARTAGRG